MRKDLRNTKRLFDYFRVTNETRRQEIEDALTFFDTIPNSFSAVCSFETNQFIFISPQVEKLLAYPLSNFLDQGYQFLFQLIPDVVVAKLMAWQSEFAKMISDPDFDYTSLILIEFSGELRHADKSFLETYQKGIILEFEPGGDTRTFFSLWIQNSNNGSLKLPISKVVLQRKLKEFHQLLLGPSTNGKKSVGRSNLIKIKAPHFQEPKLTKKEKELLLLLSQGLELKAIAKKMKVSYFTSESHRKHLFEKFGVRNVAELIQKASKVYWLE